MLTLIAVANSTSLSYVSAITSNQSSRTTSSSIFRGNISFTDHSASGYTHPISFLSSYPSPSASSFPYFGAISFPISTSSVAHSTIPTETSSSMQPRTTLPSILGLGSTLKESGGNTRSNSSRTRLSQSVILAATSSSAVLVVTETNSAGTIAVGLPITTTITSPPPSYRTSLVSNTLWHSDTTTTSGATIFPVFYSCGTLCGGDDHGLIIKGLGGEPTDPIRTGCGQGLIGSIFRSPFSCGTEFHFPPLLPFAIGVDGAPEIVRDLDPKSTNLPSTASMPSTVSMTSTSMTSASMTSTNLTSTSMTSRSLSSTGASNSSVLTDCATGTAFSCTTSYICLTEASVSCSATSTCSAIATGCSLTDSPSSATPSSLPSRYVIYPIDGASQSQINGFASLLNSMLGVGKATKVPLDETESVFVALMNSSTVADLKSHSIVSITCINSMNEKNN